MKIIAVIPARMGSSRFPGKPLALIAGKPMIEHVYTRTKSCLTIDEVIIATCDAEIADAARKFGAHIEMTSDKHERASDRMAEVAGRTDADIYVMVQGDEPLITPEMIDAAIKPLLKDENIICTNLIAPIKTEEEFTDRNTIKVISDKKGNALYMSREPIPTQARKKFGDFPAYKQVCVIPFRRDFLLLYTNLTPTPFEQAESVDMLRAMEHGYLISMVKINEATQAVDTPADLKKVEALLK